MIAAVTSDLEKEPLIEILNKYFTKFPLGKSPKSKQIAEAIPEGKKVFIENDTKQFFISLVYPLPMLASKNFVLASMLENLPGK